MKHAAIAIVAGLFALSGASAMADADFTVPPVPHHYVTDGANALDEATRSGLEAELHTYEQQTGHQVIVWIGETTNGVPLETWTAQTAHEWRIGRKGHDDGAVLFLFMRDRRVRIEVGYGLEGELTDADAKRIIDEQIVPQMRAGNPGRAVTGGVAAMLQKITPEFSPSPDLASNASAASSVDASSLSPWALILTLALFFAVPIAIMVLMVRLRGHGGASGAGLTFGSSSSGSGSSSSDDDDFDSGGGDFGGGGASGSW